MGGRLQADGLTETELFFAVFLTVLGESAARGKRVGKEWGNDRNHRGCALHKLRRAGKI